MQRKPNPGQLTLRIVLEKPPAGVDFGVQSGSGSVYETVQQHRSAGDDLTFDVNVDVRAGSDGAGPDFAGPFVQGPKGQRFVYIDIGTYAGQADSCWSRRLKIPLNNITLEMTRRPGILKTRIPGTGKDGGPSCGTSKAFSWHRDGSREPGPAIGAKSLIDGDEPTLSRLKTNNCFATIFPWRRRQIYHRPQPLLQRLGKPGAKSCRRWARPV